MILLCPSSKCNIHDVASLSVPSVVRKGSFFRKSDSKTIARFYCRRCRTHFSHSTQSPRRYQKARRITPLLENLLCSGVSQRRAAIITGVDRKTAVRRFRFLAREAEKRQIAYRSQLPPGAISEIQFDDLETSEHTKCKPISVTLAVEPRSRKILSFKVSRMPAKGLLARVSRRKYGRRRDERPRGWDALFQDLKPLVSQQAQFTSDENPHYSRYLRKYFPEAAHIQIIGGRGAITGQGELKKKRFDPLFSLNHTCAMLRANMNRLFRKTWCTTKNIQGLRDHLALYVAYHNERLTPASAIKGAS